MDEDIDMDAPQISTLREEVTPPPVPKSASTARRSKASTKPRTADFPTWPRRKEPHTEEEFEEAEEEEDQLIDDDDDDNMKPVPPAALSASRSGDSGSKRKSPAKKKPRNVDKRAAEDGKNASEKAVPSHPEAPPLTWLAAEQKQEDANAEQISSSNTAQEAPPKVMRPKQVAQKAAKPKLLKIPPSFKPKGKLPAKYDTLLNLALLF
jgi:Wiskott-Aldrich syndrome protein